MVRTKLNKKLPGTEHSYIRPQDRTRKNKTKRISRGKVLLQEERIKERRRESFLRLLEKGGRWGGGEVPPNLFHQSDFIWSHGEGRKIIGPEGSPQRAGPGELGKENKGWRKGV